MKYVCIQCGKMLPVDRDIDDDRTFDLVLARHNELDCPHAFIPTEDIAIRLRLAAPALPAHD